ncbi:MAG: class I SAM-dependent methyltransferase [Chlamydiota bacterium]
MHFLEELLLPFLGLKVCFQNWLWERGVKKKYYVNKGFAQQDSSLFFQNRSMSPYLISKVFMQKKGEKQSHVYGETPLYLYDKMANRWGLKKADCFVELGCGRGRGLFFLSRFYGCQCIGLEWIPQFVEKAQVVISACNITDVTIYLEDFVTSKHIEGDFIYLYGCLMEDKEIVKLCNKLAVGSKHCKIITVSFSLQEYHEQFIIKDQFEARFPWGIGTVFLNQQR